MPGLRLKLRSINYLPVLLTLVISFLGSVSAAQTPSEPPEFSSPAGTYTSSFELELTAGPGAEIYFTLTGDAPQQVASQLYEDPISVSGTQVVRAMAVEDGLAPSESVTKVYTQLGSSLPEFSSNLPLIIINEFGSPIGPDNQTIAYFSTFGLDEATNRATVNQAVELQSRIRANVRGSSSQAFPKKMFATRLIDETGENRNEPVLGLPSENNWILYAPYSDKTLMRNVVAYRLSEMMGHYAPRTRFVEVFLHNGSGPVTMDHYHGVYVLVERIKWDNNRVNITKIEPEDNQEPEITGGYIFKKDRLNEGESGFTTNRGSLFAHTRPSEADITPQQQLWLRDHVTDFENTLFGQNFADPATGYASFIDVDSFIDYHLIVELLKEIDGFRLSTFLYKDRGGKMVLGPVWDYNLSLGNANYADGYIPEGWYHELINQEQYLNGWYTRLFQDPVFFERWRTRYWELREGVFGTEFLGDMISGYAEFLEESQQRNFTRWPILGQYVWPNHFIGQTYADEIDFMSWWLSARQDWMDSEMGEAPDFPIRGLGMFWYFNEDLPNNTPLETVDATFSYFDAHIEFKSALEGYPFTEDHPNWRKASMERRNRPTMVNYLEAGNGDNAYDEEDMRGLQIRQPFTGDAGENELILHLPTNTIAEVTLSFAAVNEGAATTIIMDYSVVNDDQTGAPVWTQDYLDVVEFNLSQNYRRFEADFTDIVDTFDNGDFKVRFRFAGLEMAADEGNRVTFNNIALEYEAVMVSVEDPLVYSPDTVELEQNYPNPFNNQTRIPYALPEATHVQLEIYNMLGQRVAVLIDQEMSQGRHMATFDATGITSGVYFYRLTAGNVTKSQKMLYLK